MKTCSFPGCDRKFKGLGLCAAHLIQQRVGRSGLHPIQPRGTPTRKPCALCPHGVNQPCSFEGCKWMAMSHGLCPGHAWQRDNNRRLAPLPPKTLRGATTKVEQGRKKQHRRRANQDDVRVVTARDWRRLVQRYNGLCAYCRDRPATDQDHVIPVARGGRFAIGNLLPACRPCNSSKGAKLLVEWKRTA